MQRGFLCFVLAAIFALPALAAADAQEVHIAPTELCTCGLFHPAITAGDRNITDAEGKSVVLWESLRPDFFRYTNERSPFPVDVPALFTQAVVIPDNRASGDRLIGQLMVREFFESERKNLGVKDENYTPQSGQDGKDVIWQPTHQALVDAMLNMANVTASDYVIDLGAGDGRMVITAAKRGATALGIEYNLDLVKLARRAASKEGVSARAAFKKADIFKSDFSKATVLTLFLLGELNLKLRPKILNMKPGTRIVSNTFDMADWQPDETTHLAEYSSWNTAHLWIVPAKVNGTWKLDGGKISFIQKFQSVTGTLTMKNEKMELTGTLVGDKISFIAGGTEYTGTVKNKTITGTHAGGGSWKANR